MTWHVQILTLFPEMFPGPLGHALSGKALDKGLWQCSAHNIRDHATDRYGTVDDTPCGGGAGMVLRADVLDCALRALPEAGRFIYLTPRGTPLTQVQVKELAAETRPITLLCGRYEGVDQRVLDAWRAEEISVGDYVLSGGELAAMVLMDACVRLLPGVMGNTETAGEESFENGLLEYPHYTRPTEWTDGQGTTHPVPHVLLSGHHANIRQWRQDQATQTTQTRRPDLWARYVEKTRDK